MSVRLMSKVFNADIKDVSLQNGAVSAAALNSILLAMADHANDDGYGSYPSLTTLQRKCKLSRPTVVKAMKGSKKMGAIVFTGVSHRGTNSYRVIEDVLDSIQFPSKATLLPSKATLPAGSKATLPESSFKTSITGGEADIFKLYEENIGVITPMIADELRDAEKTYPRAWFGDAFKECVTHNARNWKYALAVLKRWKENGRGDQANGNGHKPTVKPPEDDGREMVRPTMLKRPEKVLA